MKVCTKCNIEKSTSEYGVDKSNRGGYRYECKVCYNARSREYARNNKELIKVRNAAKAEARQAYYQSPAGIESSRRAHLKRMYNITLEEYNKMSDTQDHKCAICGGEEMNYKNKVLCVDHNHITGEIRGLLCGTCNIAIGHFKDNIRLLEQGIQYLNRYNNE